MDSIREFLKSDITVLDGGMGTLLQEAGLSSGEHPEMWNIKHADKITEIHKEYFDAGSNIVNTNTFGANILKFSLEELEEIIKASLENARRAASLSTGKQRKFVSLDIGPTGKLLKPYGDLDFEDAVEVFATTVRLGAKYGADLVTVETMNDSYETKAALLAVKESCDLPVIVTNAYGEDGKLMTGASPEAMVAMLEGLGADVIGVNCSLGPKQLLPVVERMLSVASVPIAVKPNAGLPVSVEGKTLYDVSPADFADDVLKMVKMGACVVGGCCGTTPEYIAELVRACKNVTPASIENIEKIEKKNITVVSSYTHAVELGKCPVLIGERINPTGKKKLKEALKASDLDYILGEGIGQAESGAYVLDVNVGLPEIDEKQMLTHVVCELQAVCDLPLQIDTADADAMEAALRRYNGKAMINSVNGKSESMSAVFPLAKKYGGVVVALTLDESGIPEKAEGRIEIAKRILSVAGEYGIDKRDIVFDPLAMTVSADPCAATETLRAVKMLTDMGCKTSLGVSNVSFGLPSRDFVNATFFTQAMQNGLSAAIMNPYSVEMKKAWHTYRVLNGLDENCADYIAFASSVAENTTVMNTSKAQDTPSDSASELQNAIVRGLTARAGEISAALLNGGAEPLSLVENDIIPALDRVGRGFESKTVYLPSLLMSAEAAKAAFSEIKKKMENGALSSTKKMSVVLATVHGDIHDIGKNIVKLLLENYGFSVIDLGRDVPAEQILEAVNASSSRLVGLSALMTTTVPAMEQAIKLLRENAPECKIIVGGAVLNEEYAMRIGADAYSKDAMQTVRYAEALLKGEV